MLTGVLKKVFGSRNERLLKQYRRSVATINALEPSVTGLSDDALRAKTEAFMARFTAGESLDDLLPEAFAVVREASKRALGMRHFDVQMIGGIALHEGKIAEMRTGEGKTLTATLAVYLNALTGNGVHLITVNDYLAQRDAEWMGRLYGFLGLTVGVNLSQMPHADKQTAYAADITYGTNNEFGFDYLRDNMVYDTGDRVQRGLAYAIVDEVDSILIDEARTPLIISGQAEDHTELYVRLNTVPAAAGSDEGRAEAERAGARWRLLGRRERSSDPAVGGRSREVREDPREHGSPARRRIALRPGQHPARPPPDGRAARPQPLSQGSAVRGPARRGAGRGRDRR